MSILCGEMSEIFEQECLCCHWWGDFTVVLVLIRMLAIEGCSFCPAAQRSFILLVSNFLRVAALNSVGDFILLLAKLCISFISAGAAVLVFMVRLLCRR